MVHLSQIINMDTLLSTKAHSLFRLYQGSPPPPLTFSYPCLDTMLHIEIMPLEPPPDCDNFSDNFLFWIILTVLGSRFKATCNINQDGPYMASKKTLLH